MANKGPVNTNAIIILVTFFMIRELEGAVAKMGHMAFCVEDLTVTWALPVSKTDYTATGRKRTWGCTCIDPERPGKICPYHVAYEHKEMLRARLWKQFAAEKKHMDEMREDGIDPWDDEDLPLFPRHRRQRSDG